MYVYCVCQFCELSLCYFPSFAEFINITSKRHYAIGSQASFRCDIDERRLNFSRVYLAVCHLTDNCSKEGDHRINLMVLRKTSKGFGKKEYLVGVKYIPLQWCGRVFAVCVGKNQSRESGFKTKDVLLGSKLFSLLSAHISF